EKPRGADAAPGLVPDLGEHDGLAAGHQLSGFADEGERLLELLRRRPGEIAADLLVPHDLEQIGRVTLRERLEREPAAAERDGRDLHLRARPSPGARRSPPG